jgi:uncharacterized membrane protein
MLIVAFDGPDDAFALNAALADMRREMAIETQDTEIVTRSEDGEVHLHNTINVPLAQTLGGAVWGLVLGAAFLLPVAGLAVGAATGALVGRGRDPGVDSGFLEELGDKLPRGGSALCLLVRKVDAEGLLRRIKAFPIQGTVLQSPLDRETEARLRAAAAES